MNSQLEIDAIKNLPFFFILGRPRTGTTLLRSILDAHPNIKIPPENGNLIHLYFKYRNTGLKWNTKKIDELISDFIENRAIKTFWKADFTKAREMILSCTERKTSFSEIIKIIYFNSESLYPKNEIKILGDKSPVNSLYANELRLIFPIAKFVHLYRDYRGNLSSMRNHDIFTPSVSTIVLLWKKSINQIESLASQYPTQYLTIRYEDFVIDPQKLTTDICKFIGVPYLPIILDSTHRNTVIEKAYNREFIKEWQPNLQKEISPRNIHKWKENLSKRDILKSEYLVGELGEKLGYQQTNQHFNTMLRFKSLIKIACFNVLQIQRYIYDRLPYSWKIRIRNRKFILSKEVILLYKRFLGNQ